MWEVLDDTDLITIDAAFRLRDAIKQRLLGSHSGSMSLLIQSFGFKHGVPSDADMVFDARCLPNPYWQPELRDLTDRIAGDDRLDSGHGLGRARVDRRDARRGL